MYTNAIAIPYSLLALLTLPLSPLAMSSHFSLNCILEHFSSNSHPSFADFSRQTFKFLINLFCCGSRRRVASSASLSFALNHSTEKENESKKRQ